MVQAALCGCVGLVCGLLLETTLLMLRMNMPAPLDKKYGHLMDKSWEHKMTGAAQSQQDKQQPGSRVSSIDAPKPAAAASNVRRRRPA